MKESQQPHLRRLRQPLTMALGLTGLVMAAFLTVACAKDESAASSSAASEAQPAVKVALKEGPALEFRGTISGDVLDVAPMEGETFTPEAKHFLATGENPYRNNEEAIKKGYTLFSTACSGCHGHLAEGKLGPALADEYWTYPKNETDKGIFETIYGGAAGMMGPQQGRLQVDEIIHIIAWIRHQAEENLKNGGAATPHG
ncbi:cytochrome c(L), periplasmic [Methylophilus sp. VKM B-3414]|uniref:cytochrome c(L), periplasmic n=1 Tax=Methylophilus sp. VKM B-3414 TaxID=3076121 RepID=UPI0028C7EEDD|nr:cytochrome c(L), periplasmic [Methylophilus sp. VKM B-3414]MDT7848009.1 cytochrome c(L), periplasmic [Methylophilus sp. VKM B-3414]